ncbi:unnamed protein product, partial [Polarella glacialis]
DMDPAFTVRPLPQAVRSEVPVRSLPCRTQRPVNLGDHVPERLKAVLRLGAGTAGLAAVVSCRRHRRRKAVLCRRAFAGKTPEQLAHDEAVAEDIMDQMLYRHGGDQLLEGQQVTGLLCPECGGGQSRESAFSVKVQEGRFLCNCHRAKCRFHSSLPIPGEARAVSGHQPVASSSAGGSPKRAHLVPSAGHRGARFGSTQSAPMGKREPVSGQLLEYLVKERCIPEEVVRRNHVSQMKARFPDHGEEEAIVFAYHADDRVVAEKLRTIAKRFISTPGGEACLYGVDDLVGADVIVLTEGEMDKLSVEAAGIQAVASLHSGCGGGCSLAFGAAESLGHAR